MKSFLEMWKIIEQEVQQQSQQPNTSPQQKMMFGMNQQAQQQQQPQQQQPQQQQPQQAQQPQVTLQKLLGDNYSTFVQKLDKLVDDPKVYSAIKFMVDRGQKVVPQTIQGVKCTQLRPTQNEVVLDKSLSYPLRDLKTAQNCLFSNNIKLGNPIVTSNGGKYVIDGHHRWSQCYCVNPNATMEVLDIGDLGTPEDALKAVQVSIGVVKKDIPFAKGGGINLFTIDQKTLYDYINRNLRPEVAEIFVNFLNQNGQNQQPSAQESKEWNYLSYLIEAEATNQEYQTSFFNDKQAFDSQSTVNPEIPKIRDYIWSNVQKLQKNNTPVPPHPNRELMPQTDDAPGWQNNITKITHAMNQNQSPRVQQAPAQPTGAAPQNAPPQQISASVSHEGPSLNEWLVLSGIRAKK